MAGFKDLIKSKALGAFNAAKKSPWETAAMGGSVVGGMVGWEAGDGVLGSTAASVAGSIGGIGLTTGALALGARGAAFKRGGKNLYNRYARHQNAKMTKAYNQIKSTMKG